MALGLVLHRIKLNYKMDKYEHIPVQTQAEINSANLGYGASLVTVYSRAGTHTLELSGEGTCQEFNYAWSEEGFLQLSNMCVPIILEIVTDEKTELYPVSVPKQIAPTLVKPSTNAVELDAKSGVLANTNILLWYSGRYIACPSPVHHSLPEVDILLESSGRLIVISKVKKCTVFVAVEYDSDVCGMAFFGIDFNCACDPPAALELNVVANDDADDSSSIVLNATASRDFQIVSTSGIDLSASDDGTGVTLKLDTAPVIETIKSGVAELKKELETSIPFFSFIIAFFKNLFRDGPGQTIEAQIPCNNLTYDLRAIVGLVLDGEVAEFKVNDDDVCSNETHTSGIEITTGGTLILNSTRWIARDYNVEVTSGGSTKTFVVSCKPGPDAKLKIVAQTVSGHPLFVPKSRIFKTVSDTSLEPDATGLAAGCKVLAEGLYIGKSLVGDSAKFTVKNSADEMVGTVVVKTCTNYPLKAASTETLVVRRGSNTFATKGPVGYVWFDDIETAYLPGSGIDFPWKCFFSVNESSIDIEVSALNASRLPTFMYSVMRSDGSGVKNWHCVKLQPAPETSHDDIVGISGQSIYLNVKSNDFNPSGVKCSAKYIVNDDEARDVLKLDLEKVTVSGDAKGNIGIVPKSKFTGPAFDDKIVVLMTFPKSDATPEERVVLSASFLNNTGRFAHVRYGTIAPTGVSTGSIWEGLETLESSSNIRVALDMIGFEGRAYQPGTPMFCSNGIVIVQSNGDYAFSPNLDGFGDLEELSEIFCYTEGRDPTVLSLQKKPVCAGPFVVRVNKGAKYDFSLPLPPDTTVKGYAYADLDPVTRNTKIETSTGTFKCERDGKGRINASKDAFGAVNLRLSSHGSIHVTSLVIVVADDVETLTTYPTREGNLPLTSQQKLLKYQISFDGDNVTSAADVNVKEISKLDTSALFVADASGHYSLWTSSMLDENIVVTYVYTDEGVDASEVTGILSLVKVNESVVLTRSLSPERGTVIGFVPKRDPSPAGQAIQRAINDVGVRGRTSSPPAAAANRRRSASRPKVATYYMYPEGSRVPINAVAAANAAGNLLQKIDVLGWEFYTIGATQTIGNAVFRKVPQTQRAPEHIVGCAGSIYYFSENLSASDIIALDARTSVGFSAGIPRLSILEDFRKVETIQVGFVLRTGPVELEHYETFSLVVHPCNIAPKTVTYSPKRGLTGKPFYIVGNMSDKCVPEGETSIIVDFEGAAWSGCVNFIQDKTVPDPVEFVMGARSLRGKSLDELGISEIVQRSVAPPSGLTHKTEAPSGPVQQVVVKRSAVIETQATRPVRSIDARLPSANVASVASVASVGFTDQPIVTNTAVERPQAAHTSHRPIRSAPLSVEKNLARMAPPRMTRDINITQPDKYQPLLPEVQVLSIDELETVNSSGSKRGERLQRSTLFEALIFVPIPVSALNSALGNDFVLYADKTVCRGFPGCIVFAVAGKHRLVAICTGGQKKSIVVNVGDSAFLPTTMPSVERLSSNGYPAVCTSAIAIAHSIDTPVTGQVSGGRVKFNTTLPVLAKFVSAERTVFTILL